MRFITVLIISLFIHTEIHSQLLPATVKKPTVNKPAPTKKITKPIAVEPSKEPIVAPQVRTEIKNEVKPNPVEEKKSTLKIIADDDALIYVDGEKVGTSMKEAAFKLSLSKGVYNIKVVSSKLPVSETKEAYRVDANGMDDMWNVGLKKKEVDYWSNALINLIKPFITSTYFESFKFSGIKSSTLRNHSIELKDEILISKFVSIHMNAKGVEDAHNTNLKQINIRDITGFAFKLTSDKLVGEYLWLNLTGDATTEIFDTNTKVPIIPKTQDVFTMKIINNKQSELEPKLVELFKNKPF